MKKLVILLGCLILVLGFTLRSVWQWWHYPMNGQQAAEVLVGEGSSLSAVAAELAGKGALQWPRLWSSIARLQGVDGQIKRGEYRFDETRSPAQLLAALVAGRVIQYSVTLPEGISLDEALGILQQQEPLQALLDGSGDPRLFELVAPMAAPEGLFFPDTYIYSRGESDLDILRSAHRRMLSVLDAAWENRDVGLPYADSYAALIMASIVEKETGLAEEREHIAGVFVRRLERDMRLQTDPTVIYGLGPAFDGNLRRRHLDDSANPYNTYKHKGLPPTPIALPGAAAIEATLHPAAGEALFFVARGDGSHQFSATLEEHQQAVKAYQLQRRKDYRSAPSTGDGK
jgi:UPF0755 protein